MPLVGLEEQLTELGIALPSIRTSLQMTVGDYFENSFNISCYRRPASHPLVQELANGSLPLVLVNAVWLQYTLCLCLHIVYGSLKSRTVVTGITCWASSLSVPCSERYSPSKSIPRAWASSQCPAFHNRPLGAPGVRWCSQQGSFQTFQPFPSQAWVGKQGFIRAAFVLKACLQRSSPKGLFGSTSVIKFYFILPFALLSASSSP